MCYLCNTNKLNGFFKIEKYSNTYIKYRVVYDLHNDKYYHIMEVWGKDNDELILKDSIEINYCPYCGRAFK